MPQLVLVAAAWVAGLLAAHHRLVPLGVEPFTLFLLGLIPTACPGRKTSSAQKPAGQPE